MPLFEQIQQKVQRTVDRVKSNLFVKGSLQKIENAGGYLTRDGIPFFYLHWHMWTPLSHPSLGPVAKRLSYLTLMNAVQIEGEQAALGKPGTIPQAFIKDANRAFQLGILAVPRSGARTIPVPETLAKNHPEELARNHRGEPIHKPHYKNVARISSPWHLKRVKEAHISLALWCREHPGILGPMVWEETLYRHGGYGVLEIRAYHQFLSKKYGSINRLNKGWQTSYPSFSKIAPPTAESENQDHPLYGLRHCPDYYVLSKTPERVELSGNALDFIQFKLDDLYRTKNLIYNTFKKLSPYQPILGCKSANGPLIWFRHQWTDVSGYSDISQSTNLPSIRHFNKVPQTAMVNFCQFWHYPSGGWPHYPFYRGPWQRYNSWPNDFYSLQKAPYARILKEIFAGVKSIFMEDYSAHDQVFGRGEAGYHYIHRRKHFAALAKNGKLLGWGDQPVEFTAKENELPPVNIEEKTLALSRAYQLCYRLAPLFLPAKVLPSQVGILITLESRYTLGGDWIFYEVVPALVELLEQLHTPADVIHNYTPGSWAKYKVLFVTPGAKVIDSKMARKLQGYVRNGGRLVFMKGAAELPLANLQKKTSTPLFNLDRLLGARFDDKVRPDPEKPIIMVSTRYTPSLKKGEPLPSYTWPPAFASGQIPWVGSLPPYRAESTGGLLPLTGGKVLAEMDGVPAIIAANQGKTITMICPQLQIIDRLACPFNESWRRIFGDFLDRAGVKKAVRIEGKGTVHLLDPGVLKGPGYWLVGIQNFDSKPQRFKAFFGFLDQGRYDISDLTGERPLIYQDKKGLYHLKEDPQGRKARMLGSNLSHTLIAKQGLELKLPGRRAVVLIIRWAGQKTWINGPASAFRNLISKPTLLIIEKGCSEAVKKEVKTILKRLSPLGKNITEIQEKDIQGEKVQFAIKVDGYVLEKFLNYPLKINQNLLLISQKGEGRIISHLKRAGNFAYDKVLEKVTRQYPGPGRGIIQMVESIHSPVYDATSKSRHAILVEGSDAKGTLEAVKRMGKILAEA